MIARELSHLSLEEALQFVFVYAEREPAKYERAALRWLGGTTAGSTETTTVPASPTSRRTHPFAYMGVRAVITRSSTESRPA
jgi:hypothetical protein